MKESAFLINVARGGVVDHEALLDALQRNLIAGAAMDVTEPEPLPRDHPLLRLENCLILLTWAAQPFRPATKCPGEPWIICWPVCAVKRC